MSETINRQLEKVLLHNGIEILYACESGSRAWGFASPDSDYDVRFIYVHSKEYYLSIEEQRDVFELPIDNLLDINGWELRKALKLFRKSNAPLFEWLQSPIVYQSNASFRLEVSSLLPEYFSPRAMMHHYLSMAKSIVDVDLSGSEVKLKKYFYALRPALACRWIADRNEVPPMEFGKLRKLLDSDLNGVVDDLIEKKAKADEKATIKPIMELHRWLANQIDYCENHVPEKSALADNHENLNLLFRKYIV